MKINDVIEEERRFKWYKYSAKPVYYWSYGMLCDPSNMRYDGVTLMGRAQLPGYKLELLSHANVVPHTGDMWGTLWKIDTKVLDQLDMIEGYPYYYTRISRAVKCDDAQYEAQIYVMTDESRESSLERTPSTGYVKMIAAGYNHAGIPIEQLKTAWLESRERTQNLEDKSKY